MYDFFHKFALDNIYCSVVGRHGGRPLRKQRALWRTTEIREKCGLVSLRSRRFDYGLSVGGLLPGPGNGALAPPLGSASSKVSASG